MINDDDDDSASNKNSKTNTLYQFPGDVVDELLTDHYFFGTPRSAERGVSPSAILAFPEAAAVNFARGETVFFGYAWSFLRNSDFGKNAAAVFRIGAAVFISAPPFAQERQLRETQLLSRHAAGGSFLPKTRPVGTLGVVQMLRYEREFLVRSLTRVHELAT